MWTAKVGMRSTHEDNSYNVEIITIGTEPSSLLDSAMGKGLRHPTISMLWGYIGRLKIDRESQRREI